MFTTRLKIEAIPGENTYVLIAPLIYISIKGKKITVPLGFETDFASVPAFAKCYIDDNDFKIRSPAVMHDFLYTAQTRYLCTRIKADTLFREALIEQGMRKSKAWFIYYLLRWFGGSCYENR